MKAGRQNRTRSRTSKCRRKQEETRKRSTVSWPEPLDDDESVRAEETDRLLLSSLRYWEVERDLIEERLGHT